MRIIAGKFKNKKIEFIKNNNTRPLKDNVKENIFNILEHSKKLDVKIKHSNILDLYAGIGSFGIECLSRGAMDVWFVENDKDAFKKLQENLNNLKVLKKSSVYFSDVFSFFEKITPKKKFDIIFLDPPYADMDYLKIIEKIKENEIVNKNHIISFHREKNKKENLIKSLNIVENRIYGRSELFFGRFF